jgi:hypothetical protein
VCREAKRFFVQLLGFISFSDLTGLIEITNVDLNHWLIL